MRVGVIEWAEPLIVLLDGRIKQGERDVLPVNVEIGDIAPEYCWNKILSGRISN